MRTAFAPKLASAVAVCRALAGLPVRATVLFSSTAALFGAPGQGNYAAANAALEALAGARSVQGQHALAIRWGAWAAGEACRLLSWTTEVIYGQYVEIETRDNTVMLFKPLKAVQHILCL